MFSNLIRKPKTFTPLVQETATLESDHTQDGENHHAHPWRQAWTPTILRSATLVAFALLFAAMIVVIEVLSSVSARNQGLGTSESKYHYLWTYGPTAALTIVAALWGQVEYRTKQLMPWRAMAHSGPQPASRSLLLDYVSEWNVIALFRSMRHGDWAVVLAILGTLLIKLLTVASTGLFMLQTVWMEHAAAELHHQARFAGLGYNGSLVDGSAATVVAGARWQELPYPVGTTEEHAFQPFTASSSGNNLGTSNDGIISGTVDVFSAGLNCHVATVANWTEGCTSSGCEQTRLNITLSTSTSSCAGGYRFPSFQKSYSSAGGYYADVFSVSCVDAEDDPRVVVAAAHWTANKTEIHSLVCSPLYSIAPRSVSLRQTNHSVVSIDPPPNSNHTTQRVLADVSPADLGVGFVSSLTAAADILDTLGYVDTSTKGWKTAEYNLSDPNSTYPSAFAIIANLTAPHPMRDLLNTSLLESVARPMFAAIAAQVAKQYLLSSSDTSFEGTYSAYVNRLLVKELSVRLMEATLAVLIVVAGALCFLRPARCTPRDPGTISGLASILARSPAMEERLLRSKNGTEIASELNGRRYHTQITNEHNCLSFTIATDQTASEIMRTRITSGPMKWWEPISVSISWRIITVALPLLVIAGLETTYQISSRHNGLGTVSGEYIRYIWVYIPAVIMLVVRIFFDSIHFSALVLQPYLDLRRGGVTAPRSIMENHLSSPTLVSFFKATLRRQGAVGATAVAVLLAPILTVAVSGLYLTQEVAHSQVVSIARVDSFNTTIDPHYSTSSNAGVGLAGALVVAANLSYPAWTYEELVLPTLGEASLTSKQGPVQYRSANGSVDRSSVLQMTLPGLRARLECQILAEDTVYRVEEPSALLSAWNLYLNLDPNCSQNMSSSFAVSTDYPTMNNTSFGSLQYMNPSVAMGHCPTLMGWYGVLTANSTKGLQGFTCDPYVDQVDAGVTFTLPGLQITGATANESSRRLFSAEFSSDLLFPNYLPQATNNESQAFDEFFSAMIHDQKTLTVEDITGAPGDLSRYPAVINATQHLYRVLMAQGLNGNSRIFSANATTQRYSGTLIRPNRVRLIQNGPSTRILEGCLAAMALSVLVACYFLQTKEVIPVNPCSIAGAASLLAGSDLVRSDVLPAGSEWCGDQELLRRGVFAGWVFGLGWWDGGRFGVDIGRAE
ncbi:DUF3433 domain-containing protein [Aspergillus brunneoviolaceus CBS 621.78]|uniref:Uncharacterized protein n=1 Tax=Aspergillus brunneoviolaceus CBS 621.78 TaxID=1450534 RepID=A0ACD1FZF6_9EURO|nr:hypothetical protein BO95DRAFT_466979 [Aspergillus brunneoviolaceus CBS 621.78]RAH42332.1 hypothetical protein BO95DRAFT_466979 [Aspergillus brunneoviolaceus CBS 621.78]